MYFCENWWYFLLTLSVWIVVAQFLARQQASLAIHRILNFYPEMAYAQVLMDLSLNLQAVLTHRLLPGKAGRRVLATEMLLHSSHVADQIQRDAVDELCHSLEKTSIIGSHSFDQSLLTLYQQSQIAQEVALANADSRTGSTIEHPRPGQWRPIHHRHSAKGLITTRCRS